VGAKWNKRVGVARDANEAPIVRDLEKIGASVMVINDLDLLVGFRGANYLLEVKIEGKRIRKGRQTEFYDSWNGQKAVVHSFDEARNAIGAKVT
jgi:hypothetical protein